MNPMHKRRNAAMLAIIVLAVAALAIAAFGGNQGRRADTGMPAGNGVDAAFAEEMVAHHQSAVEMAMIARSRATTQFVKTLADDVIAAQTSEITKMRAIRADLPKPAGNRGTDMRDMGMAVSPSMLRSARPFDRAFVDMMVPHHQGAIRMARIERDKGTNPGLRRIADAVVSAQAREIKAMNDFRTKQYGAPSPAGGVPSAEDSSSGLFESHGGG